MITLEFGKIVAVKPPRVDVSLQSYNGENTISNALVLTCGGQSQAGATSWFNFSAGDVVACLVDDERPENALVIGGVYGDLQAVPLGSGLGIETAGDVCIKANAVFAGQKVTIAEDADKTCRDRLVQGELNKIKAVLNGLIDNYNAHTHSISVLSPENCAAIVASATSGEPATLASCLTGVPTPLQSVTYVSDKTEAYSVYVY